MIEKSQRTRTRSVQKVSRPRIGVPMRSRRRVTAISCQELRRHTPVVPENPKRDFKRPRTRSILDSNKRAGRRPRRCRLIEKSQRTLGAKSEVHSAILGLGCAVISVVKPAEHRCRDHLAVHFSWTRGRRVTVEREMTAGGMVIVIDELFEGSTKVLF